MNKKFIITCFAIALAVTFLPIDVFAEILKKEGARNADFFGLQKFITYRENVEVIAEFLLTILLFISFLYGFLRFILGLGYGRLINSIFGMIIYIIMNNFISAVRSILIASN